MCEGTLRGRATSEIHQPHQPHSYPSSEMDHPNADYPSPMGPHMGADELSKELHHLHQGLRARLAEAQDVQASYYDKTRKRLVLQKGDQVWLLLQATHSTTSSTYSDLTLALNHNTVGKDYPNFHTLSIRRCIGVKLST